MTKDIHFIYCYGGNRNFGDDYILELWIDYINEKYPDQKVLVGTPHNWMQANYIGKPVYFNDILGAASKSAVETPSKGGAQSAEAIERAIQSGYEAADELLASRFVWRDVLSRVRAFHVAGGGFVNDIFLGSFARVAAMARLAEQLDVPLYGTGLGLLPHANPTPAAIELFRKFELIECRDEESHAFLTGLDDSIKSLFGYDDTFLSPPRGSIEPDRGPVFFVNVQSDMNVVTRHEEIARAVKAIAAGNPSLEDIRFLHFSQRSDHRFHKRLKADVKNLTSYGKNTLLRGGLPMQPGDFVLTSRFHCHFLASRLGAKGVFVSARKDYYDVKHRSITRLGSNWVNFDQIKPDTFDVTSLAAPAFDEKTAARAKVALAERILGS